MNKQKGDMYDFVTHTWNPIKGKCEHDCSYCYMKVYELPELHLAEKELRKNLGKDNFVFVGSATDIFAKKVNFDWIVKVLYHCNAFNNKYLFQSKNPERMYKVVKSLCKKDNITLGTTIETNRHSKEMGSTPPTDERAFWMRRAKEDNFETMITLEPLMDFDLDELVTLLRFAKPDFVNIGADSKGNNLPEPDKQKVKMLIEELNKFTVIRKKNNLGRLIE